MIASTSMIAARPALLATGEPMPLSTPVDDAEWLDSVSKEERARVREVLTCFREMLAARNLKAGAQAAAARRAHLGRGWKWKTLLNLFWVYRDGGHKPGDWKKEGPTFAAGDWRILLREYAGKTSGTLPEAFKRWLCEQWAQFKGRTDCVNATWRHVVYEVWLKGQAVQGYGTIDDWCRTHGRARPHPSLVRQSELPDGWTEATFRRALPKRKVTRQAIAHGYLAAHNAQPDQILTDRSGLLPLQYVFLDDTRPDRRCTWFGPGGRGEIVYPLLVLGLDAATSVDLEAVTKPRALKEAAGSGRHGVTQDMAVRVVCGVLRRFGLPPWPVTFVHEQAAACIPAEVKHLLEGIYGDRIQFEKTSIFRERMMEHGFTDQGGAPYNKAPIEVYFRLLATQIARGVGATGPRYDAMPGELAAIEDYTGKLILKAGGFEEVFRKFRSPLLDWEETDALIMDALRLFRFRTKHQLQGFDRLREWRRSPAENYRPWSDFLALGVDEQNAIAANGDAHAIINRLESPAERFCRLLQGVDMTPVDDDLLTFIEGPRATVRVLNGKITAKRVELGDDLLVFREEDHPLLAEEHEGRTFEAAIARDASRVVLTQDGKLLGSVAAQGRVTRGSDAWRAEMGRVASARKADREHLRGYLLADTDTALGELRAHNAATEAALPQIAAQAQPRIASDSRKRVKRARARARARAGRAGRARGGKYSRRRIALRRLERRLTQL
jgi:hypothetical protein